MANISISMTLEKTTDNTFRYKEEAPGQPPKIKHLYIQKWALPNPPPRRIEVHIELKP